MKLYYTPGVCSLAPHINLREAGIEPTLVRVDIRAHKTESGDDFYAINPKGYVPALELEDASLLTEGLAINLYIASKNPKAGLVPEAGSMEYIRLIETFAYISTELHKNFGPLFMDIGDKAKEFATKRLPSKFELISKQLGAQDYLMGSQFTIADAYLFTVLNWATMKNVDISHLTNLADFHARVAARPAVQAAMKAEGLLDAKAA